MILDSSPPPQRKTERKKKINWSLKSKSAQENGRNNIYLSIYLSIQFFLSFFLSQSIQIYLCESLFIGIFCCCCCCLFVCVCVCARACVRVSGFHPDQIFLSIYLSIYLCVYVHVCVCVCVLLPQIFVNVCLFLKEQGSISDFERSFSCLRRENLIQDRKNREIA